MSLFPFTAVVGNEQLKLALILNAIEPKIGGVLISGPRGSAKSTLARALPAIADVDVSRFVTLPLGATEERIVGTLNIEKVMQQGEVAYSPGLLHKAHEGVLYVDEVNLLPDHLVDLLLDAAASGINYIERDGVSHSHPAKFMLIGTMNPDEGELRPQLLDRFGLSVSVSSTLSVDDRMLAMRHRIDFDNDGQSFVKKYLQEQEKLRLEIAQAKSQLVNVEIDSEHERSICVCCQQANVEGLRADITLLRAAKAYCAWKKIDNVNMNAIDAVKELVLSHRQHEHSPNKQSTEKLEPEKKPAPNSPQTESAENKNTESQGEWGQMPPVASPMGERRDIKQILPAHDVMSQQKKNNPKLTSW